MVNWPPDGPGMPWVDRHRRCPGRADRVGHRGRAPATIRRTRTVTRAVGGRGRRGQQPGAPDARHREHRLRLRGRLAGRGLRTARRPRVGRVRHPVLRPRPAGHGRQQRARSPTLRVHATSRTSRSRSSARTETAWRLMSPWGVTPENARLERHAVYTFRGRWASEWRSGRVLLAGDAAHLMPPFLGQGLCAGLRDARALTWRLDLVRRGLADESVLDSYGSERREHVREIIEEAVSIGRVICELDPHTRGRARCRAARRAGRPGRPHCRTTAPPPRRAFDHRCRVAAPRVGCACRRRCRVAGATGLFDDLVGGAWQLIGVDVDPSVDATADELGWFAELGGTVSHLADDGRRPRCDRRLPAVVPFPRVHGRPRLAPTSTSTPPATPGDVPRMLSELRLALTATRTHREAVRP